MLENGAVTDWTPKSEENQHGVPVIERVLDAGKYAELDHVCKVLQISYGQQSVSLSTFRERMSKKGTIVYIARLCNKVVGASYVHLDGKRGATGVLPSHRGQKIASKLIIESQLDFQYQYTEVMESNELYIQLLELFGFRTVTCVSTITRNIESLKHLITSIVKIEKNIVYERRSLSKYKTIKLRMLEWIR